MRDFYLAFQNKAEWDALGFESTTTHEAYWQGNNYSRIVNPLYGTVELEPEYITTPLQEYLVNVVSRDDALPAELQPYDIGIIPTHPKNKRAT